MPCWYEAEPPLITAEGKVPERLRKKKKKSRRERQNRREIGRDRQCYLISCLIFLSCHSSAWLFCCLWQFVLELTCLEEDAMRCALFHL